MVQHGPDPQGADLAHDLPLLATVAYVGADCAADLAGARRRAWWWVAPTLGLVPLVVAAPRAGDVAQGVVAAVAVVLALLRARRRRTVRARLLLSLGVLAVGATTGALSRSGGPWCDPASVLQGHAVWHVLAAAGLVVLAPVVTEVPAARAGVGPRAPVGGPS